MVLRIYVSTEVGDDKNDGLSDQSPVRSARRVIALCRGDNEIVVMGGPEMLRQLSKQVKKVSIARMLAACGPIANARTRDRESAGIRTFTATPRSPTERQPLARPVWQ